MPNKVCPQCRATGHDTEGDHLFEMRDGNWGCFRAEYHESGKAYIENGKDGNVKTKGEDEGSTLAAQQLLAAFGGEDTTEVMEGDSGLVESTGFSSVGAAHVKETVSSDTPAAPPVARTRGSIDTVYRGILPGTFRLYGMTAEFKGSEMVRMRHTVHEAVTNTPLVDKVRILPKDFKVLGTTAGKKVALFGQSLPSAKRVLICEGEFDAMSAFQMLEKYKVKCVSLPFGANSKSLLDNKRYLDKYTKGKKEIYFCLDSDRKGKETARAFALLYPDGKFLELDRKDPNEYLFGTGKLQPDIQGFISCFWDAGQWKPEQVVRVSSLMTKVLEKPVIGRPWPWESMNKHTYGRRDGEGIYVGAGELNCQR